LSFSHTNEEFLETFIDFINDLFNKISTLHNRLLNLQIL